jgi:hypothetical protein
MKESMLKRIPLTLVLAIQALGGGAITLAHARDVFAAPPGFEASHDGRCAILHDELRCALCHYASARVVTQQAVVTPASRPTQGRVPPPGRALAASDALRRTPPSRAPPLFLS